MVEEIVSRVTTTPFGAGIGMRAVQLRVRIEVPAADVARFKEEMKRAAVDVVERLQKAGAGKLLEVEV